MMMMLCEDTVLLTPFVQDHVKRTMEKGLYTLEDGELIPEPTLSDKGKVREHMSHSRMLGKVDYGGGPIFRVVLEC